MINSPQRINQSYAFYVNNNLGPFLKPLQVYQNRQIVNGFKFLYLPFYNFVSHSLSQSSQVTPVPKQIDNIVIKQKPLTPKEKKHSIHKKLKRSPKSAQMQKQNRNIISNLLRIFLRNLLEFKLYDSLIRTVIRRLQCNLNQNQFYQWIDNFKINYKNYIRTSQLSKILTKQGSKAEVRIFAILLQRYLDDEGLRHCLTSKKVNPQAVKMHLVGIREIKRQIACYCSNI